MRERSLCVFFAFKGEQRRTYVECVDDVREGLFLDADLEWTKKADWRYWIPPAQIVLVINERTR